MRQPLIDEASEDLERRLEDWNNELHKPTAVSNFHLLRPISIPRVPQRVLLRR